VDVFGAVILMAKRNYIRLISKPKLYFAHQFQRIKVDFQTKSEGGFYKSMFLILFVLFRRVDRFNRHLNRSVGRFTFISPELFKAEPKKFSQQFGQRFGKQKLNLRIH